MSRAWTDEEARKFTAPCADRWQWDAWLARVRAEAARKALSGLADDARDAVVDRKTTWGHAQIIAYAAETYSDAHYPEEKS